MLSMRKHYSIRYVGLLFALLLFVTVCVYYGGYSSVANVANGPNVSNGFGAQLTADDTMATLQMKRKADYEGPERWLPTDGEIGANTCPVLTKAKTDIDTSEQFSKFEFQPFWITQREFWDDSFEKRYIQGKSSGSRLPLKVIIVPHSHNDPGWLKTYEGYFHSHTRNILNHVADKLPTLKNMTFIWSEMSFFSLWWESAHLTKKRVIQEMLEDGRLEIVTGGWVMTDEATSHLYAMVNQLIEGHQWIKNNLQGVNLKTGWSVDPFGHGSTVPYLLKSSGIVGGAVIQRIHYAWKQWFAKTMQGDFLWRQNWDSLGRTDMLIHNQPFDIYTTKHTCGPHTQVCIYYDFRKIPGEFTDYSLHAVPIDQQNIKQKADTLVQQFERTGSLLPHRVVMMPLGDDFRFDHEIEWDQQYTNYKRLIDYINGHKEAYNVDVAFGTPNDYFQEIRRRSAEFPTLKGDFFAYSDVFTNGRAAYWSGYYTTRPYWKLLDRELERNLRSAEILYTFGMNRAHQRHETDVVKMLERNYEKLVRARRHLALFQHHDAITGTSKAFVMRDYALKLIEGIQDSVFLQTFVVQDLLFGAIGRIRSPLPMHRVIVPESDFESYDNVSPKVLVNVSQRSRKLVIFNSFGQHRQEMLKLQVDTPYVRVVDASGKLVLHQINPVWNMSPMPPTVDHNQPIDILANRFELIFVANLEPLSLHVFTITRAISSDATLPPAIAPIATVYCQHCRQTQNPIFQVKNFQQGDIQLENRKLQALFDGKSGFLKGITKKETSKRTFCEMYMGAYRSAQFHSGAYLFQPDVNAREIDQEALLDSNHRIVITSGPVASELTVITRNLLTHSARVYHSDGPLAEGIYIENIVDFGVPPKNRETEMFMRFSSGINNGKPPVFYTDTNGVQMQRRVTVERIGIEGNYYPATTGIYIEDDEQRLSLLVDHSQGAAAWQPGWLEVMLDRRTLYDDGRGMGEGLVDNKKFLTKYWLLLEDVARPPHPNAVSQPSLLSNYLSNSLLYPPNMFLLEDNVPRGPSTLYPNAGDLTPTWPQITHLISKALPCDVHLFNFRTLTDQAFTQFPSKSALLILHRQGFACDVSPTVTIPNCFLDNITDFKHSAFRADTHFSKLQIRQIIQTSLTGLYKEKEYDRLDEINVFPMELVTVNITYV